MSDDETPHADERRLDVAAADGHQAPLVAFVTMRPWGRVYARIGRWLKSGFMEIGASADIVYLDGGPSVIGEGTVDQIELGVSHARKALPALIRYLSWRQPEMTLATPGVIGLLTVLAGQVRHRAVVPWEATVPRLDASNTPLRLRPYRTVSTLAYRRAARVAAVSHGVRDALAADLAPGVPAEHLVVIPNPVDADEIRRLSQPVATRDGKLRFCSVGRLVSAKGFDVLIEALAIAPLGSAWELVIVGDGPLRKDLQQLAHRHRLDEHVRFLGWVENPYPVIASADVAVLASRWEGFGMVVSEALALGVPQIATDCPGGVRDTLGNGEYGVLVPPDDPAELARALSMLADDPDRRRGLIERGLERVEQHAPRLVAERIVTLAHEVRNPCGSGFENRA